MKQRRFAFAALLACCIVTNSWSQTNLSGNSGANNVFVGSTPCDALIKSLLKIPADTKCDFIKWNLSLDESKDTLDTYQLTALYGESQPNTNGFKGGGEKIAATGKYTAYHGVNKNPNLKFYRLNGERFQSPIFLIEMDHNILHFADSNKRFIVGNGGWGYVLNRIK